MNPTLAAALAWLDGHTNLERQADGRPRPPTLDRIRRLCALLGDPQHAAPVIHITGTNGKGSTARLATALLTTAGLTVGSFTSPHLERVNERIAWNGEPVDDEALAQALLGVAAVERLIDERPTWFELLTAAAYRFFADVAVDVAVVEVGLLGRWDATNVADGQVAVVTNVGLDHTEYAGPTRAHVAAEKAGIVKPGATLVLGEPDPAVRAPFLAAGAEQVWLGGEDFACAGNRLAVGGRALDLRTPAASYQDVFLSLHGAHQGDNAACALAAVEALFDRSLGDDAVREAWAQVAVPGRFEVVARQPLVVLDGAHNPDGARAAAATLRHDFAPEGDRILVVGFTGARDPREMLEALDAGTAREVVACAPDWPRAVPVEVVAAAAVGLGVPVEAAPSVVDAVTAAVARAQPGDCVLVAGSLYVVGAARAARAWERGR